MSKSKVSLKPVEGVVTAEDLAIKYAPKDFDDLCLPGDFIFGLPELVSQGASNIILAGPRDIGIEAAAEMLRERLGRPVYNMLSVTREDLTEIIIQVRAAIAAGSGFILTTPHLHLIDGDIRAASRCLSIDPEDPSIASQIKWSLIERATKILDGEGVAREYREAVDDLIAPAQLFWTRILIVLATYITRERNGSPKDGLNSLAEHASIFSEIITSSDQKPTALASSTSSRGSLLPAEVTPALMEETASLLNDIRQRFLRHIYLGPGAVEALTLAVAHYWTFDTADNSPILAAISAMPECGKSRLLRVMSALSPPSYKTVNATAAGIFQAAEQEMLIFFDEAELYLDKPNAPIELFNAGVSRDGTVVLRANKVCRVWSPKVIAKIGAIQQESLETRCIVIDMMRAPADRVVERIGNEQLEEFANLQSRCQAWATEAMAVLRKIRPTIPSGFTGRLVDKWESLLVIADLAGPDWVKATHAAAIKLETSRMANIHPVEQLLLDIHEIFSSTGLSAFKSEDLLRLLQKDRNKPWASWSNPQFKLAQMLRPFNIRPKNVRTPLQGKGYSVDQFRNVFDLLIRKRSFTSTLGTAGTAGTASAIIEEDAE